MVRKNSTRKLFMRVCAFWIWDTVWFRNTFVLRSQNSKIKSRSMNKNRFDFKTDLAQCLFVVQSIYSFLLHRNVKWNQGRNKTRWTRIIKKEDIYYNVSFMLVNSGHADLKRCTLAESRFPCPAERRFFVRFWSIIKRNSRHKISLRLINVDRTLPSTFRDGSCSKMHIKFLNHIKKHLNRFYPLIKVQHKNSTNIIEYEN